MQAKSISGASEAEVEEKLNLLFKEDFQPTLPVFIISIGLDSHEVLSLSYDIIKANGGAIKAETAEGKGATFTISMSNS